MFELKIEPLEILHTIFGVAKRNARGYYVITTRKEGNHRKYLHRLIWEKSYGKISANTHIHHIDENPLNNCIWNLDSMTGSEHTKLHNTGKNLSEETKRKISAALKGENCYWYGKKRSEEDRKKMSESKKGEKHPMYGKRHSNGTINKMSEARNAVGYFRVHKQYGKQYKQGFRWRYAYSEGGKQRYISRTNLKELEEEVKKRGFEWRKFNEEEG